MLFYGHGLWRVKMTNDINELKRLALEKYFSHMNDRQKEAVFCIRGPLLILAGAGSGKTTVLVNRIANMIFFGDSYNADIGFGTPSDGDIAYLKDYIEGRQDDARRLADIVAFDCVRPWNILAITFTNKAAGELKDRLEAMLGEAGQGITAATFHSVCARILRREGDRLGYDRNYTIYDTDDTQRSVKRVLSELEINDKMFPPKLIMSEISHAKDSLIGPEEYIAQAADDYRNMTIGRVYKVYQQRLSQANAMDFDDIIVNTVRLFEEFPDVLDHYQNLYKYILVDEYQDTNRAQFRLISLLAEKNKNLCVVGDDDQSIYKFRGATIENILGFEEQFEDGSCKVIKLEQNYRSTQNILTCANELISHNKGRKGKNLWTAAGDGEKVTVYKAGSERTEAQFIADTILEDVENGMKFNDHAVLYRMNANSNSLERTFIQRNIPYKIIGGPKFYDRKEIKDVLAYLQVINNPNDMLRLRRIINVPKRGIGEATVTVIEQIASDLGTDPVSVMEDADALAPLSRKAALLKKTAAMFSELSELADELELTELLDEVIERSGYADELKKEGDEGAVRLENIAELKSTMQNFIDENEEPTLSGFLEEISLYTDIDNLDRDADYVVMMTMHSAKGLEFPVVFAAAMEENIFPSARSRESEADIEEERRLAYVAVTRAKERLYLTFAAQRLLFGRTDHNKVSRFIKELPQGQINFKEEVMIPQSMGFEPPRSISLQEQQRARSTGSTQDVPKLCAGDRVGHKIFGEGTVLSVKPMANDMLVEIAFDDRGTKKVMAKYAKLRKL